MNLRSTGLFGALCAVLILLAGAQSAAAANAKVTISGKAYIFNHMDTAISNATVKVREFPKLSAKTDAFGDYELTVPNDANVTPYILSGAGVLTVRPRTGPTSTQYYRWNEIDLQTFHTRGQDLRNANFQAPADPEFNALKALLSVPEREDGRPAACAIVTTASARNVRDVSFETFWDRTPHGVPGATSVEFPALEGPIYFNESVIPDRTKTETSEDGGIIWPVVPAGTYRIVTTSPSARFASFLATCKPGRVVNANPPLGAYELGPGEKPLGASNVAAKVTSARLVTTPARRTAQVRVEAGEAIKATLKVRAGGRTIGTRTRQVKAGSTLVTIGLGGGVRSRQVAVRTTLRDASGVAFTTARMIGQVLE